MFNQLMNKTQLGWFDSIKNVFSVLSKSALWDFVHVILVSDIWDTCEK